MRSISSSVRTCPGVLGTAVRSPAGDVGEAGEGRTAPSWAAAAVEALPITRGVGVPSIAAAVQTSLRAVAYASAPGWRARARAATDGVGPDRYRLPREAASKNSSALRSPPVWPLVWADQSR